jgi:predicted MPP superfamily phosphohydrolase
LLNNRHKFVLHRPRRGPWLQFGNLSGFETNRLEFALSDLPAGLEGVRILHLSDLHLRRKWPAELDEVIRATQASPPHLILFTGDFVDDKRDHRAALPLVQKLMKELRATHGLYAVVGNHDGDLLGPRLMAWGVQVIVHRRVEVSINDATIELIGLPGPDRLDLSERFLHSVPPRREGMPRIVLSHYPDLICPAAALHADLFLAGHTHGGQMCLPSESALLTHDTLPRRLCKGANDVNGTCLLVNRGLGFTTIPARVFCPAEVVEIILFPLTSGEG